MPGIESPPAEGRWDLAGWDLGVWDGDAISAGISLLEPGSATRHQRAGHARAQQRDHAASARATNVREGSAVGGGRV